MAFSDAVLAGANTARIREDIHETRRKRAEEDAIGAAQADFIGSLQGALPPAPTNATAAPASAVPPAQAPTATAYAAPDAQAAPAAAIPPQQAAPGQPQQQPAGWHNPPGGFGQFHVSKVPPTLQGAMDDMATHLHDHALDTNGQPNHQKGIAVSPQSVLAQTASDPAAQQGIPEDSPQASKKPHSLSPDFWDESDQKILAAARVAAQNGHDPGMVMDNLQKVRIGFVQSHIMRNLSAANVAVMSGDNAAVEKALRNVNYYLPDGADLNIKKQGGQLVYQSPLQPYLDEQGQPTETPTGQENYIPVDAAHLQMLGQAVLDPMKVNDLIVNARAAAAKSKLDSAKAYNETLTAQGALATGNANMMKAQDARRAAASGIYKSTAQGAEAEAHARYYDNLIDLKIKQAGGAGDKLAYQAGTDASKAVYALLQGQPTTVPVADSEGNPSLSPAAGHSYRDPTKIPMEYKNITPEQAHNMSALAGEIGSANRGRIPPEQAAHIALAVMGGIHKTHPGAGGQPEGNVKVSQDRTMGWFWNGVGWTPFRMTPETGGALAAGQTNILPAPSADNEEGESSDENDLSADDTAPAE